MKRVTVMITLTDQYYNSYPKKIKAAMINAAVAKATEHDIEIAAIETKIGNVKR